MIENKKIKKNYKLLVKVLDFEKKLKFSKKLFN